MEDATKKICSTLRKKGFRVTKAREHIVDAIARQKQPLTIQECARIVTVDDTSVYRTIEMLQKMGLVEEIKVQGEKSRFSLTHGHHHHVVCSDCGYVVHVPCERLQPPQKLPDEFLSIEAHDVTYYGHCKKCA